MILVAIDEVESCHPLLELARRLSQGDDGHVWALHVCGTGDVNRIDQLAFESAAAFQAVPGDPVEAILRASEHPSVRSVLVASRSSDSTRRGPVERALSVRLRKELVVVARDSENATRLRDRVGTSIT